MQCVNDKSPKKCLTISHSTLLTGNEKHASQQTHMPVHIVHRNQGITMLQLLQWNDKIKACTNAWTQALVADEIGTSRSQHSMRCWGPSMRLFPEDPRPRYQWNVHPLLHLRHQHHSSLIKNCKSWIQS